MLLTPFIPFESIDLMLVAEHRESVDVVQVELHCPPDICAIIWALVIFTFGVQDVFGTYVHPTGAHVLLLKSHPNVFEMPRTLNGVE